ncbi:hypothetical protein [Spongiimicrobium salis]|uniref:hypothetical protein n=1 Tax=Spongiimicrobium salis TaxID=1667022 RepID=UPI00374D7C1A
MANASGKNIKDQVLDLGFDIKAETFASYLEGKTPLKFAFSDYFKRRFSHDIVNILEDLDSPTLHHISLSRRSLYDIFPERFFHAIYSSTHDVNTMVNDYKNRKQEEQHSRKFFSPLEEEFFLQKVTVENEENDIFKSLGSSELINFLTNLWNIDPKFPKIMAAKILKTMPFMHKIAGNLPLLTRILETIIQENITVSKRFSTLNTTDHKNKTELRLGVNLATSGSGETYLPHYIFTIKDIKQPKNIEDYLPNGRIRSVVLFFLEHTLPFEASYEVDFTLAKKKQQFVMSEDVYASRLGISATI